MTADDRDPAYQEVLDATGSKSADFAEQILQATSRFLSKPPSELDVLDLGSGYGFTAAALAGRCRRVVGYEPSAALVENAVRLQKERGLLNLTFERKGIEGLDAADAFDLIVLDNVFEHLPDQSDALRRLAREVRRGGEI